MAKEVDIGMLIARNSAIRGGRPCIAGTGITVQRIISWYKLGLSPEEISSEISHISLAQVYAALAYYHANKEEIETALSEDKRIGEKIEKEYYNSQKAS